MDPAQMLRDLAADVRRDLAPLVDKTGAILVELDRDGRPGWHRCGWPKVDEPGDFSAGHAASIAWKAMQRGGAILRRCHDHLPIELADAAEHAADAHGAWFAVASLVSPVYVGTRVYTENPIATVADVAEELAGMVAASEENPAPPKSTAKATRRRRPRGGDGDPGRPSKGCDKLLRDLEEKVTREIRDEDLQPERELPARLFSQSSESLADMIWQRLRVEVGASTIRECGTWKRWAEHRRKLAGGTVVTGGVKKSRDEIRADNESDRWLQANGLSLTDDE